MFVHDSQLDGPILYFDIFLGVGGGILYADGLIWPIYLLTGLHHLIATTEVENKSARERGGEKERIVLVGKSGGRYLVTCRQLADLN